MHGGIDERAVFAREASADRFAHRTRWVGRESQILAPSPVERASRRLAMIGLVVRATVFQPSAAINSVPEFGQNPVSDAPGSHEVGGLLALVSPVKFQADTHQEHPRQETERDQTYANRIHARGIRDFSAFATEQCSRRSEPERRSNAPAIFWEKGVSRRLMTGRPASPTGRYATGPQATLPRPR